MAFIETPRFPDRVAYAAAGGPRFMTQVVEVESGHEQRNQVWADARCQYEFALQSASSDDRAEVISFFRAIAKGRFNGFRFKDHNDFEVAITEGVFYSLGSGIYQMAKRYTSGSTTYDRYISKPRPSPVVKRSGATLTEGVHYSLADFDIYSTTGRVTMLGSPTPAGPDAWSGEFDVPVRFDMDEMMMRAISRDTEGIVSDWPSVRLVEIRV